jgi:hypothetical protein
LYVYVSLKKLILAKHLSKELQKACNKLFFLTIFSKHV